MGAGESPTDEPRPVGGLPFVDEIDVTVVNVLAFVTDRDGNPVTDLEADQFVVLHDGDPRPISNFAAYTEELFRHAFGDTGPPDEGLEGPSPEELQESIEPVYIAVYVDNANLHPLDRNQVLNNLRGFVRDNLQPPTEMMVVSFERSLEVTQPFTSDVREVLAALKDQRLRTGLRIESDRGRTEVLDLMQEVLEEERTVVGPAARGTRAYQDALYRILAVADEERIHISYTLNALRGVVNMLAGLPGRKVVLYVSNGLLMVPAIDLFTAFSNTFNDPSALSKISRYDRTRMFDSLVAAANAQNVTFYTIDATGLELHGMITAEQRGNAAPLSTSSGVLTDSIRMMADETGGLAVVNTNDFAAGLERVARDLYTYYSIGYTLINTGSDRVHRVEVELPGHPDYTVRYRRRYVEKSAETRTQDRVLTALVTTIDHNPIGVEAHVDTATLATEGRWSVPLDVVFPLGNVALIPTGEDYVGRLIVFLAARDASGRQTEVARQEHEVRVPAADYEIARSSRFRIETSMLMEPGSYRVVVGLLDGVTRQSSYATTAARVGGS